MNLTNLRPDGLNAIFAEMARQHCDALASFEAAGERAQTIAQTLRRSKRLLLLGMGASHALRRALEPLYRDLGIEAVALPLSEQLGQPLPLKGHTVLVTSQSGESAEVRRWFAQGEPPATTFGVTMEKNSSLTGLAPCLIGAGGSEVAFAATRSLTVSLALHAAILSALGSDMQPALEVLKAPVAPDIAAALEVMSDVVTIVTSGRRMQGVAEAIALGLCELSRMACFSLEGGQLRHGPMEMLGERVGVVLFRSRDTTSNLVAALAQSVVGRDRPQ